MKKLLTIFIFCLGTGFMNNVSSQYHLIVAADGSGHFTSISAAMAAAKDAQDNGGVEGRVRIFIRNGTYNEPVRFGTHSTGYGSTNPISIVGESKDGVIIQYDNYQGLMDNAHPDKKEGQDYYHGEQTCASMVINGEDFYGENFTVINTKDSICYTAGLYIAGRRQAYKNINIKGNRGTLYIRNGRAAFVMDSYLEGVQEMTASNGTVLLYNSTIKTKGSNVPIAYPEDNIYFDIPTAGDTLRYGHIFRSCTFTAPDTTTAGSIYLAQPQARESGAWFIDCKLGPHISPAGIKADNTVGNNLSSWFYEYNTKGLDGVTAFNFSQRPTNFKTMSQAYMTNYVYNNKIYNKMFKTNNLPNGEADALAADPDTFYWDPLLLAAPRAIPENVIKAGDNLTWDDINGAIGFVVYLDGAYAGMSETNVFPGATGSGTYTVCSVSESGAMSKPSGTASQQSYEDLIAVLNKGISNLPTSITAPKAANFTLVVTDGTIRFESETDCQIFNLSGQCIISKTAQTQLSLQSLPKGVYLVKTKDAKYGNNVTKVVL